ncbi:MAG: glutathione S-transferase family protein [Alphaproteobacteria bacterium]|nr:glutathione S-transferase family protein [Alphaproteobacteria bacterium]
MTAPTAACTLYGMSRSVYVRIARMALLAKGVGYALVEIDPFRDPPAPGAAMLPMGKVPLFEHHGRQIIETQAIVRYIDRAFDGPDLQPADPILAAHQDQIIGLCDSALYRALVWDVFVETQENNDPRVISIGAAQTMRALKAIDTRCIPDAEGAIGESLLGRLCLADFFLAAMLDYGARCAPGAEAIGKAPQLADWWRQARELGYVTATRPEGGSWPPDLIP